MQGNKIEYLLILQIHETCKICKSPYDKEFQNFFRKLQFQFSFKNAFLHDRMCIKLTCSTLATLFDRLSVRNYYKKRDIAAVKMQNKL